MNSLMKGLNVLILLRSSENNLRNIDIAKSLGMEKSLTSRILSTLVESGLVEKRDKRWYRATSEQTDAAIDETPKLTVEQLFRIKLIAHEALKNINKRTGECCHSATVADDSVWYLDKIESNHSLKIVQDVGAFAPAFCTALGRIFLAFNHLPIPMNVQRYTPKTKCAPEQLELEMEMTRERGFGVDDEEFTEGVRCIAAPVKFGSKAVLAIGLSGPTIRISKEREQALSAIVMEEAEKCSKQVSEYLGEQKW